MACTRPAADRPPAPEAAQPSPRSESRSALLVEVVPPEPTGRFRWEQEVIGGATLLVEAGLLELSDVVVVVRDRPPPPAVARALGDAEVPWRVSLALGDDPDALEIELEVCPPASSRCRATSATASREALEEALPPLLRFASAALGRDPAPGAAAAWGQPVSDDPYAALMLGRAAATWYGLKPPPPPDREGDRAADPLARAVYIDPGMALAQWLVARRHAGAGRWTDARPAFTAARAGRPFHPVLQADEARALDEAGAPATAADAWEAVWETSPGDARFALPRARAALRAGRLDQARERLDALAAAWPSDPRVARARVELAEAEGTDLNYDVLLATWQLTDPTEPEPVLRRIHLRIRQGAYRQAWDLLPELRSRGATAAADRLTMALGTPVGNAARAARAAEALGLPDVAVRIRARSTLEQDPGAEPAGLARQADPEARVALGRAALARGEPQRALALAAEAERARPWDPAALALQAEAYKALGRTDDAAQALSRLAITDPAASR